MQLFRDWYEDIAGNNQLALLLTLLVVGTLFVALTARILAPFYAAITIAYVLQVAIDRMRARGLSRGVAFGIAFGLFIAAILGLLGLIPLLVRQLSQLISQLPAFVAQAQDVLVHLPDRYPDLINADQVDALTDEIRDSFLHFGQRMAGVVGLTVLGIVATLVYVIIVPIMVFFLLKDKDRMIGWITSFMPEHRELSAAVWSDVHHQLQNFVGGKVLQVLIIAALSFVIFSVIHLRYAPLMAAVIGIAVIIPYIGAAAATVPIAVVSIVEWGFSPHAAIALAAYGAILALDGNVLVPFLFAEAVSIHPLAIITAILLFGGIWGLWGVFFAIPLAVLVKAVIQAWPRGPQRSIGL